MKIYIVMTGYDYEGEGLDFASVDKEKAIQFATNLTSGDFVNVYEVEDGIPDDGENVVYHRDSRVAR